MKTVEYKKLKKLVEDHLLDYMPEIDDKSKTLYEAMKYSLSGGNKFIRSILILAGLEFCGKKPESGLPFACAVEYIQTYSLIHDDLPCMDNDSFRRGKPACHKVFGENIAMLAGDGLLSAAFEVINKDMLMYLDDYQQLKNHALAAYTLSKGIGVRGMVAGQVCDLENEGSICSKEMLDYIHLNKTAQFLRACALSGGYLGGADQEKLDDLRAYGENMGLAFQIVDDILDADEEPDKNTYPNIYGMNESVQAAKIHIAAAEKAIEKYYDDAIIYNDILEYLREQLWNMKK